MIRRRRDDRLRVQLEPSLLQCRLKLLQPADLAALPRLGLLAGGVDLDVAALLLGDVAGGVRRADQVLDRDAAAHHFDEPDADADREDLLLPDETVLADGTHDVVGDLPRLLERAPDQQDPELVAAEPADRVGVTHRVLDQPGDLAQHAVAGDVPALVVDGLEAIEVQVAEHVMAALRVRGLQRLLQAPLELAAIDQARQRVVARLVGHLLGKPAQVADVPQRDDRAGHLPRCVTQRSDRELDRPLGVAAVRDQHAATPEVQAGPGREALPDRVAQALASAVVGQLQHLEQRVAENLRRGTADQLGGDLVRVDDPALQVRRHHALAQRVERFPGARVAAPRAALGGFRAHLHGRDQHRSLSVHFRTGEAELQARRRTARRAKLRLDPLRGRFALKVTPEQFRDQFGEIRVHELGDPGPRQLRGTLHPAHLRETRIREPDTLLLDGDGLVHAFEQPHVELLPLCGRAQLQVRVLDQAVELRRQAHRAAVGGHRRQALAELSGSGDRLDAFAQLAQPFEFPGAPMQQERQQRHDRAQCNHREDQGVVAGTIHGVESVGVPVVLPLWLGCCWKVSSKHNGTGRDDPRDSP